VQGSHPLAEDGPKTHGLEDTVQPRQGDPVIGMVEVEAEEEARHAAAVKVLGRRENRRRPIENGAASDRTQLGRTEDTREDVKKAGNKHFG
jgi:hypothetical protein